MARYEFKLPDIGEGVAEGEIVSWLVHPGDVVKEDQPVVEVMTDKATVTITAPKAGTVLETRGRAGETVAVHAVLVVFELPASADPPKTNGAGAHSAGDAGPPAITESQPGPPGASPSSVISSDNEYVNRTPLATPATRKFARDLDIDLRDVPPTGPQGRVTKRDVEAFAGGPPSAQSPNLGLHPASRPSGASRDANAAEGPQVRVPFTGLRRRLAEKMTRSKATSAHFTFVEECDATELKALRNRLNQGATALGTKINFLPFIVKAVVLSLIKHPTLNSSLDEATHEIVFRKYYDIGIATATDAGLLVPVLKGADKKSILTIARDVERLAEQARSGKARREDLQGSTFTITSLGARSGLFATPIINFPEVAILGVHQVKSKPVVKGGQIVIGDVMLLSLSFDHRLVDGHVGAAFAYDVIRYLEQPELLLLEMA